MAAQQDGGTRADGSHVGHGKKHAHRETSWG